MLFDVKFYGRNKGAIGITQRFQLVIECDDESRILSKCYETHEHIYELLWRVSNDDVNKWQDTAGWKELPEQAWE